MSVTKYKSGISQSERNIKALQPDYVSVEERSIVDLLKFAQNYAKSVRYYSENTQPVFWTEFLNYSDVEIEELALFAQNPQDFAEDDARLAKYAKPHLAMLLTFINLLKHPKEKFAALTEKNLNYFYREVLKFEELPEVPDQVHVIFKLAQDVKEHLVKKGTLLNAGKDSAGVDLQYEVQEDIVINNAELSDIKTIHFNKATSDIKYIHEKNSHGDVGFEKILCMVLGSLDSLPLYKTSYDTTFEVDAKYLRTELYSRIKNKEKDELEISDALYIFESLCFRYLKDFWYCLDLLYREMNRGYVGVTYPEDSEWQKAYDILENVHVERHSRGRRAKLKEIHKGYGFDSMMEYAFGEPNPWNMLYKTPDSVSQLAMLKNEKLFNALIEIENEEIKKFVPNKINISFNNFKTIIVDFNNSDNKEEEKEREPMKSIFAVLGEISLLEALYLINNEANRKYIENKLCMPVDDFKVIIHKKENSLTSIGGDEVYTLLEKAWTKKRNYKYPAIGSEIIEGFYADTIYSLEKNEEIERFKTFSKSLSVETSENINMGFAVSSPLFKLNEGERKIEMVVSCKEGTINYKDINNLLKENEYIFNTYLSIADGWKEVSNVDFEIGKFIIKPELKTYNKKECRLVCDTLKYDAFDVDCEDKYILYKNKKVYKIKEHDRLNSKIYLKSVCLQYETDATKLINKLVAKEFVSEMNENITVDEYAINVTSNIETFNENHEGKFFIDNEGKIFFIKKFISASQVEVNYSGALNSEDSSNLLIINKVWETIEPEYQLYLENTDISSLKITEVYSADNEFEFIVTDEKIKINYPEGKTANDLVEAWEKWKDDLSNNSGRFEIIQTGEGLFDISPVSTEIVKTGEVIKRYESLNEDGICITYKGRPADIANLIIENPVSDNENAEFLISGKTLTITLGTISKTANQIVADWKIWLETSENNPKGFSLETKDTHTWKAEQLYEKHIEQVDRKIRKYDICDLYGNGIRVLHDGLEADKPRIIIKENEIDLFDFEVENDEKLTIKYPSTSKTSGQDLYEEWLAWKSSELNDVKKIDIELLGDGSWTVFGETEKELQPIENKYVECTVEDAGIVIMFKPSKEFDNAIVEFVQGADFYFEYRENVREDGKDKKLIITYPKLTIDSTDADIIASRKKQHVQSLLSRWNREYKKHGFVIIRNGDDAAWSDSFPGTDTYSIDFSVDFNYVKTINVDGFKVKYNPKDGEPGYKSIVNILENTEDEFKFLVEDNYYKHLRHLYVFYPSEKKNRTIDNLLAKWEKFSTKGGFSIVQSGTGKWNVAGVTDKELNTKITALTPLMDPVNRNFYEYKTKDVKGFTIEYTGPRATSPQITIEENNTDDFYIDIFSSYDDFHNVYVEEFLTIKYPKREDKRTAVNLLKKWNEWKQSKSNHFLGFKIFDTSQVIEKRNKAKLFNTGDAIKEYNAGSGNGFCITYTGYREDVYLDISQIEDFTKKSEQKNILWDNGEIFKVIEKIDKNYVTIEHVGEIDYYDNIKLYEQNAIVFDALKFVINIDREFPAVVSSSANPMSKWPSVKILLDNTKEIAEKSSDALFYDYFKSICMQKVDINVSAKGVSDIKMRGDLSIINSQNNFNPFGLTPAKSARFYFANEEICEKKLDTLTLNLNWAASENMTGDGLPNMEKHYYAYSHCGIDNLGTIKNSDFDINLKFLDKRIWKNITEAPKELFNKTIFFNNLSNQTYQGELFTEIIDIPKDPLDWPRYFKAELSGQGFMQDKYSQITSIISQASQNLSLAENNYEAIKQEIEARAASLKAAKVSEAEARANGDSYVPAVIPEARELPELPENDKDLDSLNIDEPFIPALQSISVDYSASSQITLQDFSIETYNDSVPAKLFRFHPFGFVELGLENDEDDYLLPQYSNQGYLLIGVENLQPMQNISLLLQMVSGSGDANLSMPTVKWNYLAANKWIEFKEADILKDKTYGLQDTGIVRFRIPENATANNTILPGGKCWLLAEVENNITAFPDILNIKAQALNVQYVNNNNDPEHLATPLKQESIKELASRDSFIAEVTQPYSSFNGQMQESNKDFYIRVSERLKHKNRALTLRDYENLILSKFAEIYKVKCVPQGELKILDSQSEGEVVIVIILKNKNAKPFYPLKPKTPANILSDIERYIKPYMPALVEVKVVNPRFEEIRYRLAIKFHRGYDQGYYIHQLNEDIKSFLSPWAYDQDAEISFGSSVYSSSVINFIENTDYVDYVANFSLLQQIINHETYKEVIPLFLTEDNAATVKYPDSILVSAEDHIIDVIHEDMYDPGAYSGIGYMQVGTDLWISRPGPVFVMGIGDMEVESWPVSRYAFAEIKVILNVEINGSPLDIGAVISREGSQKIWDGFREVTITDSVTGEIIQAPYIDNKGHVITNEDLYSDEFKLKCGSELLENYLNENILIMISGEEVSETLVVNSIENLGEILDSILNKLKSGQSFSGISQYPFIIS